MRLRHPLLLIGPFLVTGAALLVAAEPPAPKSRATPLFDGKTLKGWHAIGQGEWKVEDGAIVGRNIPSRDFGHLVTDKSYKDFTIRVVYKAIKGNSGVYFRIKEQGFSGVSGFQAEIDPDKDAGGLYETNGRSWVSQPKPEDVKKWYKPGEWNEMTVSAHGGNITVKVNGQTSADLKNDPGPFREGPFALQVHGGQAVEVMFKTIELLDEGQPAK